MDREEIIRIAREAGLAYGSDEKPLGSVTRFANLVAAYEREACAKVCDAVQKKNEDDGAWMWEARNCAEAIRARGKKLT
jgi:hypothetical protein